MRKRETTMPNEKLLTVLRGLSPAALRAVIEELSKLGPQELGSRPDESRAIARRGARRTR